jgi:hypothetical protein
MKRLCYLLIFFIFAISEVGAQRTVHGYLKDSITHLPVVGGIITNVTSKKKITSDVTGYFRIDAAPNDFFYVLAKSYNYDTLTYSYLFTDTISIYLSPAANLLPTVTVTASYSKYQLDSMERRAAFEAGLAPKMRTVSAANDLGFGVAINLDKFFKKRYKGREGSLRTFETLEESAYSDYRFSPHIVAHYTGFKGDTLQAFMRRYTPGYAWLRKHGSNEDVLYYINEKLKEFRVSKQE